MSVAELLERVRRIADEMGPEAVEEQLRGLLPSPPQAGEASQGVRRSRRSRPPVRLSPEVPPRTRRRVRSPARDPPPQDAGRSTLPLASGAGRNPVRRRGADGAGSSAAVTPLPARRSSVVRSAASRSAAGPSGLREARRDQDGVTAPCGSRRSERREEGRSGSRAAAAGGTRQRRSERASPSPEVREPRPSCSRRRPVAERSGRGRAEDDGSTPSDVSEGEVGGGTSADRPPSLTRSPTGSVVGRQSLAGPASVSPGEGAGVSAAAGQDGPGTGRRDGHHVIGGRTSADAGSTAAGGLPLERLGEWTTGPGGGAAGGGGGATLEGLQACLASLQALLGAGSRGTGSPVAVWGGQVGQTGVGPAGMGAPLVLPGSEGAGTVVGGALEAGAAGVGGITMSAGGSAAAGGEGAAGKKATDEVRLADAARGEVYVCFEGPLGAHLKAEVREKIWKDEYVEIFSLLPLEKFNLDRVKPDESKKEEEERRRYRLIPRTFANWLQAFAILASVVGERAPENCSALFCYQDSIGEAYRVYGGNAWLRYDEQFRQRKAVRPSLRWDHEDIGLWMRLMSAPKGSAQSFRDTAGGQGSATGRATGGGKGCCWQYNEGFCKFGSDCRFRHECSGCGGAHGLSRCFKKGKGRGGDAEAKGGNPGEGGRDAALPRGVPK